MVQDPHPGRFSEQLADIADAFTEIGLCLSGATSAATFQAIVDVTVERVLGAHAASITQLADGAFVTVAATSQFAVSADRIQYALGAGPCIDAILEETIYRPRDIRNDRRWPEFGRQVAGLGVGSMLSYRMTADGGTLASLNVYSGEVDAFDDTAAAVGLLLATHGGIAASAVGHRTHAEQLEQALITSRQIGEAIGILMATHNVSDNQAFDLLRIASQNTNRKLHEIAADVVLTGTLDVVSPPRQVTSVEDDCARRRDYPGSRGTPPTPLSADSGDFATP
jgi:hypothetical protein